MQTSLSNFMFGNGLYHPHANFIAMDARTYAKVVKGLTPAQQQRIAKMPPEQRTGYLLQLNKASKGRGGRVSLLYPLPL